MSDYHHQLPATELDPVFQFARDTWTNSFNRFSGDPGDIDAFNRDTGNDIFIIQHQLGESFNGHKLDQNIPYFVYLWKQGIRKKLIKDFFKDDYLINRTLIILEKFLKLHIEQQIKNGVTVIQIFDSWAGLLEEKDLPNYVYSPTLNLVNYVKSLNIPVICFPREIKNYKEFCDIVKPDAVSIDYNVDPKKILNEIKIPVQGGLDPKILLTDKKTLKKEALKYLDIFKDHPYIFNLGHGVLPETDPNMFEYLVNTVKDY